MNNKSFDEQRIAEGYAQRPWLHKFIMDQIRTDCNINVLDNGLDVGCGAGLSTKALRLICNNVTGTDISPEMVKICNRLYDDESYYFYVAKAEETKIPSVSYDIITAAGVINWVDRNSFLENANKILSNNGLIVIYDFWITDIMIDNEKYTKWYHEEYLKNYPKPFRKENVWTQENLIEPFIMEKQISYQLEYEFELDEFVDFMLIQSNVNEKIEAGTITVTDAKEWMTQSLAEIFDEGKKTLVFEGFNWYIKKI